MIFPNGNAYTTSFDYEPLSTLLDICFDLKNYSDRNEIKDCILQMINETCGVDSQEIHSLEKSIETIANTPWPDFPLFPMVFCGSGNRKNSGKAYYVLMTIPNLKKYKEIMLALYNVLFFWENKWYENSSEEESLGNPLIEWNRETDVLRLSMYRLNVQKKCAELVSNLQKKGELNSLLQKKYKKMATTILNDRDFRFSYYGCSYAVGAESASRCEMILHRCFSSSSSYRGSSSSGGYFKLGVPFFGMKSCKGRMRTPEEWKKIVFGKGDLYSKYDAYFSDYLMSYSDKNNPRN